METKMTVIFEGSIVTPLGYASSKSNKKDFEKNTKYQALPTMSGKFIIPGEQLAGALRRAGMNDIRDSFPEDPLNSVLSFYQASVGGVAGFGTTYKVGEMTALRMKNPFVSLWGKAGLRGHIGIGHAVGPDRETISMAERNDGTRYSRKTSNSDRIHGFRSDDLARNPETNVADDFWAQRNVLRFAGASSENTQKVAVFSSKQDYFEFPLPADGDKAMEGDIATENDSGSKNKLTNIQNGYGGFEYLPNGTRFEHRFTVTGTKAEILMLMASFYGFAREPRIGGHWRHNLGWVDMQYRVYLREDDVRLPPREIGTLSINSQTERLDEPALETTGQVSEWMDAYLTWRKEGFPGMDINAGTEDEYEVIRNNLAKIARELEKKKRKNASHTSGDADGDENTEVDDVA